MTKDEMIWDLSPLVESASPALIQKKLKSMIVEAKKILDTYHGKIGRMDAKSLLDLLEMRDTFTLLDVDLYGKYIESMKKFQDQ